MQADSNKAQTKNREPLSTRELQAAAPDGKHKEQQNARGDMSETGKNKRRQLEQRDFVRQEIHAPGAPHKNQGNIGDSEPGDGDGRDSLELRSRLAHATNSWRTMSAAFTSDFN